MCSEKLSKWVNEVRLCEAVTVRLYIYTPIGLTTQNTPRGKEPRGV